MVARWPTMLKAISGRRNSVELHHSQQLQQACGDLEAWRGRLWEERGLTQWHRPCSHTEEHNTEDTPPNTEYVHTPFCLNVWPVCDIILHTSVLGRQWWNRRATCQAVTEYSLNRRRTRPSSTCTMDDRPVKSGKCHLVVGLTDKWHVYWHCLKCLIPYQGCHWS